MQMVLVALIQQLVLAMIVEIVHVLKITWGINAICVHQDILIQMET